MYTSLRVSMADSLVRGGRDWGYSPALKLSVGDLRGEAQPANGITATAARREPEQK